MRRLAWFWVAIALGVWACGDDGGSDSAGDPAGPTTGTPATGDAGSTMTDPSGRPPADGTTTMRPDPASGSGTTRPSDTADTTGATGQGETNTVEPGGGTIEVTLRGCDIDLGGTVVVTYNGSLGIASVYDDGATLTGSFQFELDGPGTMALSSQHRVDTGNVINMVQVAQGTWTNLDADALAGGRDRIGGTLSVNTWDPASGVSDLELQGVSLLNVASGNVCTVDGTIVTTELYP
ncbi:MAG: hypothetical protein AAGF11_10845 [Myxococcota bacterium]